MVGKYSAIIIDFEQIRPIANRYILLIMHDSETGLCAWLSLQKSKIISSTPDLSAPQLQSCGISLVVHDHRL